MRSMVTALALMLAGCGTAETSDYVERTRIPSGRNAPSAPLASPDTTGALWAQMRGGTGLVYGIPGQPPLMAMECLAAPYPPRVRLTRIVPADADAQAMLALVGNGYIARIPVDARRAGEGWHWQGEVAANEFMLKGLEGSGDVEATVPGAGSVMLHPSPLPGALIARCRGDAPPAGAMPPE